MLTQETIKKIGFEAGKAAWKHLSNKNEKIVKLLKLAGLKEQPENSFQSIYLHTIVELAVNNTPPTFYGTVNFKAKL